MSRPVFFTTTLLFTLLLFAEFMASVLYGPVHIDPLRILRDLAGLGGLESGERAIVYERRIPTSLAALASGALLGLSGLLYQVLLRNPMGDPYVLGVSSVAYLFLIGFATLSLASGHFFAGMSFTAPLVVLTASLAYTALLSYISYRLTVLQLIIVGVSVGFAASGLSLALLSTLPPEVSTYLALALMGSFEGVDAAGALSLTTSAVLFLALSSILALKYVDPLILGEDYARSLGIHVQAVRLAINLVAGFATAITVSHVGVVGFLGFAAPHIARILVRSGRSLLLIPTTALVGGSLALLTLLIIKAAFQGSDVPVTAITSIFGAPMLIYLVSRMRGEYSW